MIAWRAALEQVFHLRDNPQALDAMRHCALPGGMASLIRLASDAGSLLEDAAQAVDLPAPQLQACIADYLLAVCLYPQGSALRALALNDAKNMALAKEHHRLLLKWLHPDRNPQNTQHAERVNQAWTLIKNQDLAAGEAMVSAELASHRDEQTPLPKSRFGLFLAALLALAVLLTSLSFWPDDEVYVHGSESQAQIDGGAETGDDNNVLPQSWLARLGQTGTPATSALPLAKPIASNASTAEMPAPKTAAAASQDVLVHKMNAESAPSATAPRITPNAPVPVTAAPVQVPQFAQAVIPPNIGRGEKSGLGIEQGHQLLVRFAQSYQQGDLAQFMGMFSSQARSNRGDRSALEQEYRHLFAHSTRRSIRFSELQWRGQENLTLHARYDSQVKWQDKWLQVRNKGHIQLMLMKEDGKMQIQQILLEE